MDYSNADGTCEISWVDDIPVLLTRAQYQAVIVGSDLAYSDRVPADSERLNQCSNVQADMIWYLVDGFPLHAHIFSHAASKARIP